MNISKLYKAKKLAFLCAILLSFKAECAEIETGCCDPDLVDTLKSNSRKATPNILSFLSLSLGSSGFLESMTAEGGKILGFTGASIGMASTLLNVYNYYIDREQIEGFTHHFLNVLSVLSNLGSASLGYAAATCDDPIQKNALSVSSLIVGASGLLIKGIDLFFLTSPKTDYAHRHACRLARQSSLENVMVDENKLEEGTAKGKRYKVVNPIELEKK